jgi:hypothetical protein
MRRNILQSCALLIGFGLAGVRTVSAQTYTCPNQPTLAAQLRAIVVDVATGPSDPSRDSLGLAAVDTAQITVVTTDSVCTKVTNGFAQAANVPPASSLIVVKWGTAYAACSVSNLGDVYILDETFRLRLIYSVPS